MTTTTKAIPRNAHLFHDGSAVIHKIPALGKGHCTAWVDKDGNLTDAEQIFAAGCSRTRNIKRGAALWKHVARIAKSRFRHLVQAS